MFRGVTALALDAKGRLAIPAQSSRRAAPAGIGRLVLTADPSRCLLLYPRAAWEPLQARLMSLSSFDPKIRALQRLLVGHADDVEVDAAGRILVPPELRRYANLDKRVVLVGQGRKFELWDEQQWQVETAQAIAFPAGWPAAGTVRLLALMTAMASPRSRPARRSRGGAGGQACRRLRRRDIRPRRSCARDPRPARRRRAASSPSTAIPAAVAAADALAARDPRFVFRRAWFSELPDVLAALALAQVDGALFDLGISSPQIDDATRGFSYRLDGPLDMRMDPTRGESAADFLARASVRELTEVIRDYGEERFAQSIARRIAAARARAPVVRTGQLRASRGRSRRRADAG